MPVIRYETTDPSVIVAERKSFVCLHARQGLLYGPDDAPRI